MKKIPTFWLGLIAGVVLEFVLLAVGGFDLRVGGDGPASMLLFITHLPATFICGALPLACQTGVAVMVANGFFSAEFHSSSFLRNGQNGQINQRRPNRGLEWTRDGAFRLHLDALGPVVRVRPEKTPQLMLV